MSGAPEAIEQAQFACSEAAATLIRAEVAPEALAEYVPPRRAFLHTKSATMRSLGKVWRLGSLLLDDAGALYAAGQATRAAERGRPSYQSESRELRREIAAAALRGGFALGTPVNFNATPIEWNEAALSDPAPECPIGIAAGTVRVRWRPESTLADSGTLVDFLSDRVGLLVSPPFAQD